MKIFMNAVNLVSFAFASSISLYISDFPLCFYIVPSYSGRRSPVRTVPYNGHGWPQTQGFVSSKQRLAHTQRDKTSPRQSSRLSRKASAVIYEVNTMHLTTNR